jgi:hypothetical protein
MAQRRRIRPKKTIPVSRRLLILQVAGLAGSIWLLCAEWPLLKASESPIRVIGGALVYLLLASACSFGMILWTYMAMSLDRFSDLLSAALRTSVHALWFVPAMLLVSISKSPVLIVPGILMMVNSARLLVSNPPPQKRALSRRQWRMRHRLFGESRVVGGFLSRDTWPAILGAFSIQAGSFVAWIGHQRWAAALFAAGIASWTWASMARGAYQPRRRKNQIHRTLSVSTAVVLTIMLSVVALGGGGGAGGDAAGGAASGGWLDATSRELQNMVNPPKEPAAPPKSAPMRIFIPKVETATMGQGGIPGLILLPNKKKPQTVTIPATYRLRITLSPSKPVSIPFTGEYQLFRESSAKLPPDSVERAGSPLDAVYVSTNGGAMETDAYQDFDPPVDFTSCGKIQVTLTSGEMFPASATLILLGAEQIGEMGPEIFGLNAATEETVEFTVPSMPGGIPVKGIRIIFRHNPMEASHSTQVAIRGFTFVPRGL